MVPTRFVSIPGAAGLIEQDVFELRDHGDTWARWMRLNNNTGKGTDPVCTRMNAFERQEPRRGQKRHDKSQLCFFTYRVTSSCEVVVCRVRGW
jgi:hypothetical protein